MLINTYGSVHWTGMVSQLQRSSQSYIATDIYDFLLQNEFLVLTYDERRESYYVMCHPGQKKSIQFKELQN